MYADKDQEIHRIVKDALWKDYGKRFSPNCYAYVKGKSCADAVIDINKRVHSHGGYIRTDIKDFFPSISTEILGGILCKDYPDEFVRKLLSFVSIGKAGISLGSALSPLLSNIYLIEFDKSLSAISRYYRYSDDILILCECSFIDTAMASIDSGLKSLLLTRNIEKTHTGDIHTGFKYLGFFICEKGVSVALNKKEELDAKIQDICAAAHSTVKERMDKMRQSIVGWQNYYHEKYPASLTWYGVLYVATYGNKKDFLTICEKCEKKVQLSKEQLEYLIKVISTKFGAEIVLHSISLVSGKSQAEIVDTLIVQGKYELAQNLSQISEPDVNEDIIGGAANCQDMTSAFVEVFFAGMKSESHYLSPMRGSKDYSYAPGIPTMEIVEKHFQGECSLAICLDDGGFSQALVFDIDLDKTAINPDHMKTALQYAGKIQDCLKQKGFSSFICYSGYKGYHVWVLFAEMQPLSALNELGLSTLKDISFEEGFINAEIFPNVMVMGEKDQNIIKLPLGRHPVSFQSCYLLDCEMNQVTDSQSFIKSIQKNKVYPQSKASVLSKDLLAKSASKFPNAYNIYSKCEMIRHVVNKGLTNSFLGHYERLLLSYVFPAIGEEGILFMHHIMKDFLDYKYGKTEAFLKKAPPNAVSCPKIRKYLELEFGEQVKCKCDFTLRNDQYPTPILHAENLDKFIDRFESEIYKTVQQLMQAAQEKRELEKKIRALENQLDGFFQGNNIQQFALPIGTLKKTASKNAKWTIEIE